MSRSNFLVDAEWVAEHGRDPDVVLVEVDEDTDPYETNHIDGAVRIDWKRDLQDPVRRDVIDRPLSRNSCPREESPTATR